MKFWLKMDVSAGDSPDKSKIFDINVMKIGYPDLGTIAEICPPIVLTTIKILLQTYIRSWRYFNSAWRYYWIGLNDLKKVALSKTVKSEFQIGTSNYTQNTLICPDFLPFGFSTKHFCHNLGKGRFATFGVQKFWTMQKKGEQTGMGFNDAIQIWLYIFQFWNTRRYPTWLNAMHFCAVFKQFARRLWTRGKVVQRKMRENKRQ